MLFIHSQFHFFHHVHLSCLVKRQNSNGAKTHNVFLVVSLRWKLLPVNRSNMEIQTRDYHLCGVTPNEI